MGVVDQILGQFMNKREGDEAIEAGYLEHVFAIMHSKGGGLAGLVETFHQKGLGDVVRSWIGTGTNEPISVEQLERVFGRERLQELASKAGLSADVFKAKLSQVLPTVVDKLTPDGQLPDASELDNQLGALPKKG
jgi:uncharacterized protein YidB (DUF937 family)